MTREEALKLIELLQDKKTSDVEKHIAAARLKELICILLPEKKE